MKSFLEQYREYSITDTLNKSGVSVKEAFPFWREKFSEFAPINNNTVFNLGSALREINFYAGECWVKNNAKTTTKNLNQQILARAGASWEGLLVYYLNLGLIGSNAVAFKCKNLLWPECLQHATSVNYNNSSSSSENDILVVVFPDEAELTEPKPKMSGAEFRRILKINCEKYFNELSVHAIQCKSNWNDNSQTILLWGIVYGVGKSNDVPGLTLGRKGWNLNDLKKFSYSFATMPTQKDLSEYSAESTCVVRVRNLSGGNYWGTETKNNVAKSLSEIFLLFPDAFPKLGHRKNLEKELCDFATKYNYFDFPNA